MSFLPFTALRAADLNAALDAKASATDLAAGLADKASIAALNTGLAAKISAAGDGTLPPALLPSALTGLTAEGTVSLTDAVVVWTAGGPRSTTVGALVAGASGGGGGAPDVQAVWHGYNVDSGDQYTGPGAVILASHGISSIDSLPNNCWQLNFSAPFADDHFTVAGWGQFDRGTNDGTLVIMSEPRRSQTTFGGGGPTRGPGFLQVAGGYQGAMGAFVLYLYTISIWRAPAAGG